ncbi:MAG: NrfD/PsrC family molybdoenzyme membrane anchor subunit [Dehalococcoidia bacterium]|nr:NrfD/PsrC family molybdoenzyme membrane anchor subunit [Dehalococcoidia bacterium]
MKQIATRSPFPAALPALLNVRSAWFPKSALARAILVILVLGVATGFYAIAAIFIHGPALLDATDYIPWGILISTYIFFVLSSTGLCFVSSLGHVFGIKKFEAISKRAVFLAIATMLSGFVALIPDLGRPERMLFYLLTPNFTSLLWWMGFLYSIYLVFMVAEFLAMHVGRMDWAKAMGIGGLVSAVAAHSTLGGVFGVIMARPFYFGPLMPLYFLLTAFLSGLAVMSLVGAVTPWMTGKKMDVEAKAVTRELGKLLILMLAIALVITVWKMLVGLYSPAESYRDTFSEVANSGLWQAEVTLGLLIPFIAVIVAAYYKKSIGLISAAAVFILVGLYIGRLDMVLAGQIMPLKVLRDIKFTMYAPSAAEALSVVGALLFCTLIYATGEKFLELAKSHLAVAHTEEDSTTAPH